MKYNGKLLPLDRWMINAIQGLTFWVGYQHAFYSYYPLVEGALVAELRKLIQAQLPQEKCILPERMYKDLLPPNAHSRSTTRVDLVVADTSAMGAPQGNIARYADYVIEVKRAGATLEKRNSDLRRVCSFLGDAGPGKRGFVLVVSESGIPDDYVSSRSGTSRPGYRKIFSEEQGQADSPEIVGHYRVRRTCKASRTFKVTGSAHYACLLEVFPLRPDQASEYASAE